MLQIPNQFLLKNVESPTSHMLYLHTVIPPIILLSGREASSSSFFVAIGGIIFFCIPSRIVLQIYGIFPHLWYNLHRGQNFITEMEND